MNATASTSYGRRRGRPGLTSEVVFRTAEQLLKDGKRPTVTAVREAIGGSNSTVAPLLDAWWRDLSARFATGPAAFDRIPASLAHAVESLYLQILADARLRSRQELNRDSQGNERQKSDLEVRSHVLSLREAEFQERLRMNERKLLEAEGEVRALTVSLRKAQASREWLEQRLLALEAARAAAPKRRSRPGQEKPRATPKRKPVMNRRITRVSQQRVARKRKSSARR